MNTTEIKQELAELPEKGDSSSNPILETTAMETKAGEQESKPASKKQAKTGPDTQAGAETKKQVKTATGKQAKTEDKEGTKKETRKKTEEADTGTAFAMLKKDFPHLIFKNTQRVEKFQKDLLKLAPLAEKLEESLKKEFADLSTAVSEKISKNSDYQKELLSKTGEIIESLEQALEAGKSEEAIALWDKIQGNISNTAGRIKADLQAKIVPHKAKLDEFKDWKTFAATEKKKELIAQMKHLAESKMHASDRSKHINKMHLEWKNLGHSNLNEAMWKEFKKLSDLAYVPCKEFFKKRKEQMGENLMKRREICDAIEKAVESIDMENLNAAELGKLLGAYEADWKKYAPVEQSKIKTIQKRFYSGVNKLRKLRKKAQQSNVALKKQCIASAQVLAESEDNKKAMTEAKKLQEQWKTIGSTTYREDDKLWKEFRAACDQIFSKAKQQSNTQSDEQKGLEKEFNEVLSQLEALFAKAEDEFRDSRNEFQELSQKFANSFDHQFKKRRKRLVDQFSSLKRKIEIRYASLPDKKQQELKAAILESCAHLEKLEASLLSSKDEIAFKETLGSIEESAWNEQLKPTQEKFLNILNARFKSLANMESLKTLQALAEDKEIELRNLCIMTELRAEIDSPVSDQALRMQLQLQLLQKGFGQAKLTAKDDRKQLFELEMESACFGPLADPARKELEERMQVAINKLRQRIL